jgi:hypothetical protein
LGNIYFETGDFAKPKKHYERGIGLLEDNRICLSRAGWAKAASAKSKVMNNEEDVDLESLYPYSYNNKIKAAEGWVPRDITEILLNIDG